MTPTRTVSVPLGSRSYDVVIGVGISRSLGDLLPTDLGASRAVVITHPELVPGAEAAAAGFEDRGVECSIIEVPSGESSKSMDRAGRVLEEMATAHTHRGDLVVTYGGGVITDLGGFVASVYARGLDVVHIPTTLLAQVDAAVGGKTGVNLTAGKNLVGTFHQPRLVVCDVSVLATLPEPEFVSGLAEVIKCGLISDPQILGLISERTQQVLQRDPATLTDVITAAVRVKADIVSRDETDASLRAILNYGHTFAHAIELDQGYGQIRHGEAVSLGMMAAAFLANEIGSLDDTAVEVHRRTLASVGLPVTAELHIDSLEPGWALDKKFDRGVRFVLLEGLGRPRTGVEVDRAALERALERMSP